MSEQIKINVPASTSNLGPGFDVLSLALDLHNSFIFKLTDKGLKINLAEDKNPSLPEDSNNLVYKSFCEPFKILKKTPPGLELNINSRIPLARGLGSSATAIVSGLLAANFFLNNPLSKNEILNLATKIEGHPDNVAAALFGGLTVSVSEDEKVSMNKLQWPSELLVIVVVPHFDLPTRIARELLPAKVPYGDAVFNVGCVSYLLSCLLNKDWEGLKIGFQDRLHQPYRKDLVPGMDSVLNCALQQGALGATLSGAGPTLVAFINDQQKADLIGRSMVEKWKEFKVVSNYQVLKSANEGAKVESLIVK